MKKKKKRNWSHKLLELKLIPWLGAILIRLLYLTFKTGWIGREAVQALQKKGQPFILVFWHDRLLMMSYISKGPLTKVLVSQHKDGELISRVIKLFGYITIRGSTSHGGMSALRNMARELERGTNVVITPDGPRGPRHQAQNGAVALAYMTGCPIIPVTYSTSARKHLSSWDQFLIPFPFSRAVYIFDAPIWVGRDLPREELEQKRLLMEERLNTITQQADHYVSKEGR